jgi:hypothetical protein
MTRPGHPVSNSELSLFVHAKCNVEQSSSFMVRSSRLVQPFVPNNAALLLDRYMEVVPAAGAMRRIAVSLIPTSTRYDDEWSFSAKSKLFTLAYRSSSWIREELESLFRAWTNAALLTRR